MERDWEEGESRRCEVYSKKSHGHSGGFHFYMGIRIGIFVIAMAMAGTDSTSLWSRLMCGAAILLSLEKLNLAQLVDACLKGTRQASGGDEIFGVFVASEIVERSSSRLKPHLHPPSLRYQRFFITCQPYSQCRKREDGEKMSWK